MNVVSTEKGGRASGYEGVVSKGSEACTEMETDLPKGSFSTSFLAIRMCAPGCQASFGPWLWQWGQAF